MVNSYEWWYIAIYMSTLDNSIRAVCDRYPNYCAGIEFSCSDSQWKDLLTYVQELTKVLKLLNIFVRLHASRIVANADAMFNCNYTEFIVSEEITQDRLLFS